MRTGVKEVIPASWVLSSSAAPSQLGWLMEQSLKTHGLEAKAVDGDIMTEQNRKYVQKEIGKLLSEVWRIKGLSEQEYGQKHPITKKLVIMHAEVQTLLKDQS